MNPADINCVVNNLANESFKVFFLADKIRQDLLDKGISIEDKDGTTSWKLK